MKSDETWTKHRKTLRKLLERECWEDFTSWSVINATMFVGEAPYIVHWYKELMKNEEFWKPILRESMIGQPSRLSYASWTSGQMVRLAYHLSQWGTNFNILNNIYEFGAGYGTTVVLARRLGFNGNYLLYDLPEFARLQRYYLGEMRADATHIDLDSKETVDLFIAMHSLSESPMHIRNKVLRNIESDAYLFCYQPNWNGINNKRFFEKFTEKRGDLQWRTYPNPFQKNVLYTIGRNNEN